MHEGVVDINYGFPRLSKQGLLCLKEAHNICVLLHTSVKPRGVHGKWEHHASAWSSHEGQLQHCRDTAQALL